MDYPSQYPIIKIGHLIHTILNNGTYGMSFDNKLYRIVVLFLYKIFHVHYDKNVVLV